jgi:hypothetical protein
MQSSPCPVHTNECCSLEESSPCCGCYAVVFLKWDMHSSDGAAHSDLQAPQRLQRPAHAVQGGDHDPEPEASPADLSILHQAPGRRVWADVFERDALKVRYGDMTPQRSAANCPAAWAAVQSQRHALALLSSIGSAGKCLQSSLAQGQSACLPAR